MIAFSVAASVERASSRQAADQAIDVPHLRRMTLGERSLEAEVLRLFDRQAVILLARMKDASPAETGAFAHTLKGSARGIGAWRVAAAAEAVETAARGAENLAETLDQLASAIAEARRAIGALLG